MRLTPPTKRTFGIALVLLAVGIAMWVAGSEDLTEVAFWATAAGGVLLVLGSVFNRI